MGEAAGAGAVVAALTFAAGTVIGVAASVEDLRTHLLRNVHTLALAAVAGGGFTVAAPLGAGWRPGPMALGAVAFCAPWLVLHLVAPASTGFGDVKFAAALGLYLGWLNPLASLWAVVACCATSLIWSLLAGGAHNEPRPFGPALLVGAVIAGAVTVVG